MQEAVCRLNANGEGNKIITERFEVIEQVQDCRVLFEQLQASLLPVGTIIFRKQAFTMRSMAA